MRNFVFRHCQVLWKSVLFVTNDFWDIFVKVSICSQSYSFIHRITNLKYWGQSEPIISKTLQLLSDLSVGYSSVRKLVKLEAVQFVLANHTVSKKNETKGKKITSRKNSTSLYLNVA